MKRIVLRCTAAVVVVSMVACASTTMINSTPAGAKVYLNGESVGVTPYAMTDTKIVGSSTSGRLEYPGSEAFVTSARSLFSRCKMVPSDSEMFDWRAARCGPIDTTVLAMARLLLERAAKPIFAAPIAIGGRIRWVDMAGQKHACDP